jgi:predicted nucleic acid-binding protein
MSEIFVDSGVWLALSNWRDQYHQVAASYYRTLLDERATFITTNLVISESYELIRRRGGHRWAIRFLHSVRSSTFIHKVHSSVTLEQEAERILEQYADQDFSYVDAVSFALMRQRTISTAFAFDTHFRVAGFDLAPAN